MVLVHQRCFVITCWLGVCVCCFQGHCLSFPLYHIWELCLCSLLGHLSVIAMVILRSICHIPSCIYLFIITSPLLAKCLMALPLSYPTLGSASLLQLPHVSAWHSWSSLGAPNQKMWLLCCSRICYCYNSELAACWIALISFVALQVVEKLSLLSLILLVHSSKFYVLNFIFIWLSVIYSCS
jgi:hypothetical protein